MLTRLFLDERPPASARRLLAEAAAEHPHVNVAVGGPTGAPEIVLDAAAWRASRFDPWATDVAARRLADAGPFALRLCGADAADVAAEVLTRFQRLAPRRNAGSRGELFDRLLHAHRALHPLDRPLARADFEHALDAWQWTLRLDPGASTAVQAAALLHDVERLSSEVDRRIEHEARDYRAFKAEHARRGAAVTAELIGTAGFAPGIAQRAAFLVAHHEEGRVDAEAEILADADALSFFSLNAHGFFDYFGPEHTRRKVAYTLSRLRAEALPRLRHVRCRPEVEAMIRAVIGEATGGG
jgi:hypothetical protein